MINKIACLLLIAFLAIMIAGGCKKNSSAPLPPLPPSITTAAISNISTNTASGGGTITSNGGAAITLSGICWSYINNKPTINDSTTISATTIGGFEAVMHHLIQNTSYYVRAFATNTAGTGYGNVLTFNTNTDTSKVIFTYNGQSVTYGIIISASTGRQWLDRNLGASRAATSENDTAAYGDLFQWGRLADGHQKRSSDTTSTKSISDVPGHSKFIVATAGPGDWRNPPNNNLWQGTNGVNNSCPSGWHVPTNAEWQAETGITNSSTGYTQLKLVDGGSRNADGSLGYVGSAWYWTSTPDTSGFRDNAYFWFAESVGDTVLLYAKASGLSVRCIKN